VAQAKTLLNLAGTNTGDQTITLTGDVTGSGTGSFAATIPNDTVTNAKAANMATTTIKGRATAGTGDPEDLTATQVKTLLAIAAGDVSGLATIATSGSASDLSGTKPSTFITDFTEAAQDSVGVMVDSTIVYNDVTPSLGRAAITGDVTISAGSNAATIPAGTVTLAQQANLAANSIVGNNTGVAATPIALTATQTTAMLNVFTDLAKGLVPASGGGTSNFLRADGTFTAPPTGGVTDGDKGDITVSSSGTVWTIDNDAVTYGQIQNVTGNSFLGRAASGAGNVGEISVGASELVGRGSTGNITSITLGTNLSMSGTTLNATGGGVTDGDKGDITVSSSGTVWTIDPTAVSNSKLANVATATIKGRTTAGTGDPEDLTATQVKTLLAISAGDVSGLAAIATSGGAADLSGTKTSAFISDFTEASQDATGAMVDSTLVYNDATPSLGRAAITGDVTISAGSNAATIPTGTVTLAKQANLAANSIIGNNTGSAATPIALTGTQATAMLDTFTSSAKGLVPASGGGTTTFLRADGSFAAPPGGGGDAYLANTQTFTGANTFTGQVNITRNTSPGSGINQAQYVEANYSPSVGETAFATYSRFINSGSTTPSSGEHLVGLLGRASDTASGKFLLYGAESRVDSAGTASEYGAHFTFANFGGTTFTGQSLVGNLVRSEVYTDGTYTTPLNEGANVGVKVSALVGGLIKRSFVGFDEIQNQAPIGAYNAAGTQWTKIFHDSDSGFVQVSGGTGGHLKLNPASGAYIIQTEGLGLIPLTEGLALGQTGFRWAGKFTTGEFTGNISAANLSGTNTGDGSASNRYLFLTTI
jgi:hypothetical protein